MSQKKGLSLFSITILVGLMIGSVLFGPASVRAADGSGANSVSPTSTDVNSTGNTFTFTFTAAEAMNSGGIDIAIPTGFSAPQGTAGTAGYTTANSTGGIIGDVLATANALSETVGTWSEDDADACNTSFGISSAQSVEGGNSLLCDNTGSNAPDDGDTFSIEFPSNQNWSAYTQIGAWVRVSSATNAANHISLVYDGVANLTSPDQELGLTTLAANTWTYVTMDLTAARTAVRSFGVMCVGSGCDNRAIYIDYVLIGPGSPTFTGSGPWNINVPFVSMANTNTAQVVYGSGGGTSGVTTPSTTGTYTATTTSRTAVSGTLTNIASHPTILVKYPTPTITNFSPTSTTYGASPVVTISGTGFTANTTVTFNGASKTPTVASSTQLTITLNTTDTATVGAATVVVTNPAPGGGSATSTAFVVNKANVSIALGSSLNPSTYGDSVTFTATTTASFGSPSGAVTFKNGGVAFATSTITGGVATIATSTLEVGAHSITATYNSDTNFNASTSAAVSQTVNKANVSIALGSSLNPSTYGDSVTFTATTTAVFGTPSGTVTFKDGGVSIATSTLTGGVATFVTSALSVGAHSITATYNGDTNFNASTSAAVSQTVNKANITITLGSSLNPSTYGNSITFTATTTSSVGTPSGTVTFFNGATPLATSTLSSGIATFATSSLTVGAHSITAVYNGDVNFNASTSATVVQAVNKSDITIALGSSLNPSTYGDSVTFAATTTAVFGIPSGTITFFDGATSIGEGSIVGGVVLLSTSTLSIGVHSITAVYNGDTNFNASTSAAVSQTVNKANVSIALGSSLNPSTYGDSVTFTATTTAVFGTPSGTVTFFDGATPLATSTLSSGIATFVTDALFVGAHSITAVYNGDATYNASTSAAVSQTVNKASVSIALSSSLNPSTYGDSVTFTATTTASFGSPSGTITFKDGGVSIATSTLTGGVATFATSSLTVGIHSLTAVYNGDTNFNASTSATVSQTVNKANITITLGSSLNPSVYGDSVTFTATTTGTFGAPSGTVTFFDGAAPLATSTLSSGIATFVTSSLTVGVHTITAVYNGDATYNASTSAAVSQTVNKANITITLGSSLNPSVYGDSVTFTATTTATFGTPSGTVTFFDGATPLATSTLTGGIATLETTTLVVGTHSITATYNGDTNFNASTSVAISQVVNKKSITITLGSSLNPSTYGALVIFTATTTAQSGTPTGEVTFFDGATPLATSTLSSGIATFVTSSLAVGIHSITAVYNGDTNFNASTSAAVSQTVNKANITITLGSSLNPSTYGDEITFTATTTSSVGTPSGTVTFFDGATPLATSTLSSGIATFATSSLAVGIHSITAVYNGDTNFNASTSAAVSQTVNKANITITLGSSLNPSTSGDTVTFTATTTATAGVPSGTVTFKNGIASLATSTLTGGVATLSTSALSVGTHSITAVYNGDTNFNASTSATVSQVVNNPIPVITLLSPNNAEEGSATTSLTISGSLFAADATVTFDGTPLVIDSQSSTTIDTNIPASLLATFGTSTVAVTNPTPGGGTATSSFSITRGAVRFVFSDAPYNGTVDTPITVTIQARKGNDLVATNYQSDVTLNVGGSTSPSSVLVNIINGVGTTTITDTVAETVNLTLADSQGTGLDVTATTTATFAHGAVSRFTLTGQATLNVGDRAAFTVARKDQFNNPVTTGADTAAYFYTSSTSTSAVFYDAPTAGTGVTSVVMGVGTSTATVWYYDEDPGVYTITTSDSGAAPDGTTGIDDATSTIAVNAVATKFVIIDPTDGTVDAPITVMVQAQDNLNRIVTDYQNDVTLVASSTSGQATTTGLINIINGVGTTTITDTVAETVNLTLADSQGTGLNVATSTQDVIFAPGTITQFSLTHVGNMEQNTRKEFVAGRKDQYGNYISASTTIGYLYASPSSTVKFYDAASGGSEISSITLTPGNATTSFWFYSNAPATTTVTVSDSATTPDGDTGVNDAANEILVTPIAVRFELVDPTDGTVDAPITVTVRALDEFGQIVPSFDEDVTIAVTGSAVANPTIVNIENGVGTTQLTDTVAETVNLSLTDSQSTGLIATSTQQVVFGVGAFAKLNLNNVTSATAGTLVPYTVTRTDQYNNQITSGSYTINLSATPTTTPGLFYNGNSTTSAEVTSIVINPGSALAEFWYYNEVAGSYQVTAQMGAVVGYDDIVIDPSTIAKFTMNDRTSMNPASRAQYTITRKDQFDNLVTAGDTIAYMYVSPTGSSTAFYDAATAGSVVTSITIGTGQAMQNVWYYEEEAGTHTVTVSDNATAADGSIGIADAFDQISVQTATATRFVFNPSPSPQTVSAGASSVVTIQAQDDYGNADTNYQNDVTLVTGVNSAFGTGLSAGQALIDIVNGEGTITLTDNVAEVVNLALSDSQGTGLNVSAVSSITWIPGATTQFVLSDQTSMVAGSSTPYVVTRKDQFGNAVTSGSNLVYLYSNSTGAHKRFQASETSTSSISFVTLSGSMASTTFWYYDEDAGTWDITTSDNATTPDGATGIADASDSLIVTPAPVVADRYVILDPSDAGLNENAVVIIQARDADGALDTTIQEDVYLVFSTSSIQSSPMKLDGRALVSIVDGVGTVTVSDGVAETVQLSLERLSGSTSTLAITSTQDIMFFVRQTFVAGGGGGVFVEPTASFTGRAYPGAKISLFARVDGQDIPLERDIEVRADGTFTIEFSGALKGLESFGLAILDKDGKVAQVKTYDMNKVTKTTEAKNLYIAPTTGLVQRTVTIGNNVGVVGSAAPGSVIKAEVDGKPIEAEAAVGRDGSYRLLINTRELAYGGHVVRTKQIDDNGIESDYSPLKVFMVSRALVTRADLNNNGGIDIGDWSIFLTRFGSTDAEARRQVDLNDDGKVDISDFSIFIRSTVNR